MENVLPTYQILVVDDNRAIHEDYRSLLCPAVDDKLAAAEEDLFGDTKIKDSLPVKFEVYSAYQGEEALQMVKQVAAAGQHFSMAFVDVRMPPGWDGVETIQKIWEVDPSLEVVICTAHSDYSWTEIVEKLGHNDRF